MKHTIIGLGVLILGTAGLGLWGSAVKAPQIEEKIQTAAQLALAELGQEDNLRLTVSGRDIAVTGLALNEGGSRSVVLALDSVEGRRSLRADLQDLPVAAPYVLTARKERTLTASGVVPNEQIRASLAPILGQAAQNLTLAAGMPKGWSDHALAGLKALSLLERGRLSVEGQTVVLVGEVITDGDLAAVDAALAGVTMLVKDITVLDDGLPVAYSLTYSATGGGTLEGKLPFGITPETVAASLGLPSLGGAVKTALIRETGDISYLSEWASVLPHIESLSATVGPTTRNVRAKIIRGADIKAVRTALATGGFSVEIALPPKPEALPAPSEPAPAPSKTPILDKMLPPVSPLGFEITSSGCQGATNNLLSQKTILFLPNLDTLDDSASAVLADLAAIARACTGESLQAEVGGHTDTSGNADENLALSARRAEAVRAALIAAGVPEAQLTAKGYGPSQPISENETKEGRAKNRRTTLVWRMDARTDLKEE